MKGAWTRKKRIVRLSSPQSKGERRHIRQWPTRGGTTREPGGWASVPRARAARMNAALPAESVSQVEIVDGEGGVVPSVGGMVKGLLCAKKLCMDSRRREQRQ
jgi:hypothetical protein